MRIVCIISLCNLSQVFAQEENLNTVKIAKFGVDADVKSGILSFSDSTDVDNDDWFGPFGKGVIDTLDQTISNKILDLKAGKNVFAEFRMSQSNNPSWIDAVYLRDYYSNNNEKDLTVLGEGDNKNFDDPRNWTIKKGNVPAKNDIIDVYGHLRLDEESNLWVFGAVSTRTQNGDNYLDFEYYRNRISLDTTTQKLVSNAGPNGHTAYQLGINENEEFVDGDVILSINYINGGTEADFRFYVWINSNEIKGLDNDSSSLSDADFIAYNKNENLAVRRFDFGIGPGEYESYNYEFYHCNNDPNNPYGYARISFRQSEGEMLKSPIVAQDNSDSKVDAPTWKTIGIDGNLSDKYASPTFIEYAINASVLGLDSQCATSPGYVLVKTRASASFTSELKDLAGPFIFGLSSGFKVNIAQPELLTCTVTDVTLTASTSEMGDFTYTWYKDGIKIGDASNTNTLTVSEPGSYSVTVMISDTCSIKSENVEVLQNIIEPIVTAEGGEIDCTTSQVQLIGTMDSNNPDKDLTFEWTGPNGYVNSEDLSPTVNEIGTYWLTVTDHYNGCSNTASAEVTIDPGKLLSLECPNSDSVDCGDDITARFNAWKATSGFSYVGGSGVITEIYKYYIDGEEVELANFAAPGVCDGGIAKIVYIVSDECNQEESCETAFTIAPDIEDPTISCPPGGDLGCNPTADKYAPGIATVGDNCGVKDSGVNPGTPVIDGCNGSVTHTYWVVDNCDNRNSCTQTFTWTVDTTNPTISCPPGGDLGCNPTADKYAPGIATFGDNCGVKASGVNPGTPVIDGCNGSITHTYWVVDNCDNRNSCTQTFTWTVDTEDPTIICPPGGDLGCNPEPGEYAPGIATTSYNCGVKDSGVSPGTPVIEGCSGSVTHIYWVVDNCNNYNECTQTFTWTVDTTNPTISCPPGGDLGCNPTADKYAPGIATVGDNCGVKAIGVNPGTPVIDGCNGSVTHTYWVVDNCDNRNSCTQTFTWTVDTTNPTISCPPGGDLGCNPTADKYATGIATFGDNCGVKHSGVNEGTPVVEGCGGSITHTYWVIDNCDNYSECTQTFTWTVNTEIPTISCPSGGDLGCNPEPGEYAPGTATNIYNCGIKDSGVNAGSPVIEGCNGSVTHTYWVIDNCDNYSECTQTYTWTVDTTDPEIVDVPDYYLDCETSWPEFLTTTWTDNCSGGGEIPSDEGIDQGINENGIEERLYTFTVTDGCGNTDIESTLVSREIGNGRLIIGDTIVLERSINGIDYGKYDLHLLLPEDIEVSEDRSWTLYSTDYPEDYISVLIDSELINVYAGQDNSILSDTGIIFVHQGLNLGDYVFHYTTECSIVEVKVTLAFVGDCGGGPVTTAMTPNGDEENEFFYSGIDPEEGKCTVDVQIFNRWGAKIFEAFNYQNNWNGNVKSNAIGSADKISTGTYYYILRINEENTTETVTGYFYVATD